MFERYILASDFKRIESRFSMAKLPELVEYKPSFNITAGDKCYIINNSQTKEILLFDFGLRISNEVISFVRAEGDRNSDDNPNYHGSNAIFLKPELSRLIRCQRCLVLADAFIVGIGNNKPHLVYLRDKKRPFAFAGIYDRIKDKTTGDEIFSFAIITSIPNKLILDMGYKRMPVILFNEHENIWLRPSAQLSDLLSLLCPYPANLMNAYPIAYNINDLSLNNISLIQPIGKPIYTEPIYVRKKKQKRESSFPNITLAERMGVKKEG